MAARLVVYFPLADPAVPVERLDLYAAAGVDVIECGWPAQNPYFDGPDVRASMMRAAGGDPARALAEARARIAALRSAPRLLVMTYAEPGHAALGDPGALAGADALLVVAPPDAPERIALEASSRAHGLGLAAFLPLPLDEAHIVAARRADLYVMLQAAAGLTGARPTLDAGSARRIACLRRQSIVAPILLGFGISNGDQARAALDLGADGVVVGSAALRAALAGEAPLAELLADLRRKLDG